MGEHLNIRTAIALLAFIPIAFVVVRRYRPALATSTLMVFGLLFLPMLAGFKLPGLPFVGKQHLVTTWTLVALFVFRRKVISRPRLGFVPWTLILVSGVGALLTSITNGDALTFGPTFIPELGLYDTVHAVLDELMLLWFPLIIGAAVFRTYEDLRTLMQVIVAAALLYIVPSLIELRFSPQMHNWTYGYGQHQFAQTIRGTGYRPMVYLTHGLALALFTCASVLCAAALSTAKERIGKIRASHAMTALFVLLVALKSLGSLVFGVICTPLALFAGTRIRYLVALTLVGLFFFYPSARSAGTVPDDEIIALLEEYAGEERASSIEFRLRNERALITRANERQLVGWGGFCRACIFDPFYGDRLSVRDGGWIIALGDRGLVGFGTQFGMIGYAILFAYRRRRRLANRRAANLYATLTLITSLYLFDCLPNGQYNYLPYLFAGALIGCGAGTPPKKGRRQRRRRRRPISSAAPSTE